jgi:mannose-6-phosphate isomerase
MRPPLEHDERPWGSFTVLTEAEHYKVKQIVVRQQHARRSEHWFVVVGRGVVVLEGSRLAVGAGQTVDVPCGAAHRIENDGESDLVFIEVQHGDYFGEDDIVRLDDDFGRVGSA